MNISDAYKIDDKVKIKREQETKRDKDTQLRTSRREINKFKKSSLFKSHVKAIDAYVKQLIKDQEFIQCAFIDDKEQGSIDKVEKNVYGVWEDLEQNYYHGMALAEHYNEQGFLSEFTHTRKGFATDGSDTYWLLTVDWSPTRILKKKV